jgi:hypothetical protein
MTARQRRLTQAVFLLTVSAACGLFTICATAEDQPDLVLHTTLNGKHHQTYVELPFDIPSGVARITVAFKYTGKDEHATVDLGIEDPERFRGWSGGNKDGFTISTSDATPSYLAGAIIPGRWKLLLGVPNIRPQSISEVEAKIYFVRDGPSPRGFVDQPLETTARWYRGDLHMHTGHSDGRCASQSGKEVPCPVFVTLEAAATRGLDFVAVTDHNTTSHFEAMRELQPYFDKLLLIPGREITTFQGHANVFGITDFIDFRVGSQSVPQMSDFANRAGNSGALVSINHPALPSGEFCMGCGWRPSSAVDMRSIGAIEVVNGGIPEGPFSGMSFWEQQLRDGFRPTAIGGSDNHRPELALEKAGSVGSPTTVVYARELSVPAILEGIEAGHVFIDLTGSRDRLLELSASSAGSSALAGDSLPAPSGDPVRITAHIAGCKESSAVLLLDGQSDASLPAKALSENDAKLEFSWMSDGKKHWLRAEIRTPDGKLQLLSNPVYLNYPNREAKSGHASPGISH